MVNVEAHLCRRKRGKIINDLVNDLERLADECATCTAPSARNNYARHGN